MNNTKSVNELVAVKPAAHLLREPLGQPTPDPSQEGNSVGGCVRNPAPLLGGVGGGFRSTKRGFTLIELLVVIAIIAILAALLLPGMGQVRQKMAIARVQAELKRVESYITDYKAKLGFYPPDNPNNNYTVNQLFFELSGVRDAGTQYEALNGSGVIQKAAVSGFFANPQITGFVNVLRAGGEDGQVAKSFMKDIGPGQYLRVTVNGQVGAVLGTIVDGPLMFPAAAGSTGFINPFRYNSSTPTNNPNSFDLWVDIRIGGKTNRVNNWTKKPIVL